MTFSIAHLGPAGTYAEQAALNYAHWLVSHYQHAPSVLVAEPSITQTIYALKQGNVDLAIVPVENSIEGGVSFTLDTLWRLHAVVIHEAFILPINHMFIAQNSDLERIEAVYSHPQPLGQCQSWLASNLPQAQLIPTSSTAEGLRHIRENSRAGAIASERAATLNQLPIQVRSIQDYPDNCTKFWVLRNASDSRFAAPSAAPTHTSFAFGLPKNMPGALLSPLQTFAKRQINLSRIESRPAKTALGDYVFFIDAEVSAQSPRIPGRLGGTPVPNQSSQDFWLLSVDINSRQSLIETNVLVLGDETTCAKTKTLPSLN